MIFDAFKPIEEKCKANGVEFASDINELVEMYIIGFKKGDWHTQMAYSLYLPLDELIRRTNAKLDVFLEDVRKEL
jgi:hypothetical protein